MMREIIGQLHNEFFVENEAGGLVATAQVVLLYREQHYGIRQGGDVGETPIRRDFAFSARADDLRRLSEDLGKVADSLEAAQQRLGKAAAIETEKAVAA